MKFENTGIDNQVVEWSHLTEVMKDHGFILAGQWDYERVTYDYKFEVLHETYYLRVQGYAIEGEIGSRHAVIKLLTPLLGKHYYPHGVEYGEGENFPQAVTQKSEQLLKKVSETLQALSQTK
ncbi:YugN family protein [Microbacteriaceae bacterium 4G12]